MIVVVVVALSTATYAWFSSSTATTVQMDITTTADAGWAVSANTVYVDSTNSLAYSTATDQLNATFRGNSSIEALKAGIWCPQAALAPTISGYAANSIAYGSFGKFISAMQADTLDFGTIT